MSRGPDLGLSLPLVAAPMAGGVTTPALVQAAGRSGGLGFLAAYAAEGLSHFIRRFNYTNNVVGSMNVLNEAVKAEVRCFVFTSSIAVYGAGGVLEGAHADLVVVDSTTADPNSTRRIAADLAAKGTRMLDAPLGRTPREAEEGKLSTYVGGKAETVQAA